MSFTIISDALEGPVLSTSSSSSVSSSGFSLFSGDNNSSGSHTDISPPDSPGGGCSWIGGIGRDVSLEKPREASLFNDCPNPICSPTSMTPMMLAPSLLSEDDGYDSERDVAFYCPNPARARVLTRKRGTSLRRAPISSLHRTHPSPRTADPNSLKLIGPSSPGVGLGFNFNIDLNSRTTLIHTPGQLEFESLHPASPAEGIFKETCPAKPTLNPQVGVDTPSPLASLPSPLLASSLASPQPVKSVLQPIRLSESMSPLDLDSVSSPLQAASTPSSGSWTGQDMKFYTIDLGTPEVSRCPDSERTILQQVARQTGSSTNGGGINMDSANSKEDSEGYCGIGLGLPSRTTCLTQYARSSSISVRSCLSSLLGTHCEIPCQSGSSTVTESRSKTPGPGSPLGLSVFMPRYPKRSLFSISELRPPSSHSLMSPSRLVKDNIAVTVGQKPVVRPSTQKSSCDDTDLPSPTRSVWLHSTADPSSQTNQGRFSSYQDDDDRATRRFSVSNLTKAKPTQPSLRRGFSVPQILLALSPLFPVRSPPRSLYGSRGHEGE